MLSPLKLLLNAAVRIQGEENWTKGTLAKDVDGSSYKHDPHAPYGERYIDPTDPEACKWCLLGAVAAEAGLDHHDAAQLMHASLTHTPSHSAHTAAALLNQKAKQRYALVAYEVNDYKGQQAALDLIRLVVEDLQAAGVE